MLGLTPNQITEILSIVQIEHLVFIAENVGIDVLTQEERELIEHLYDHNELTLSDVAFRFGVISSTDTNKKLNKISLIQLSSLLQHESIPPLSPIEQRALKNVRYRMYNDIKGLGNKIDQQTRQLLIEHDQEQRALYESIIDEQAIDTIIKRDSVKDLVSKLGHATQDWTRDFGRISDYVMHHAFDMGRASNYVSNYGADALVYKDVYLGACKHCISAYLTKGLGSEPKIFKIADLLKNGTNIGRKSKDWKPIVGPHHPWCRCTLSLKPKNLDWDAEKKSFSKYKSKVSRAKVKVTIGDKTYEA